MLTAQFPLSFLIGAELGLLPVMWNHCSGGRISWRPDWRMENLLPFPSQPGSCKEGWWITKNPNNLNKFPEMSISPHIWESEARDSRNGGLLDTACSHCFMTSPSQVVGLQAHALERNQIYSRSFFFFKCFGLMPGASLKDFYSSLCFLLCLPY